MDADLWSAIAKQHVSTCENFFGFKYDDQLYFSTREVLNISKVYFYMILDSSFFFWLTSTSIMYCLKYYYIIHNIIFLSRYFYNRFRLFRFDFFSHQPFFWSDFRYLSSRHEAVVSTFMYCWWDCKWLIL